MSNLDTIAELLQLEMQSMFVAWGNTSPVRRTLHASAVLVDERDWCVRRHTLSALYPDAVEPVPLSHWNWKEQAIFLSGWHLHEKYQKLFQRFGQVIEVEQTHFDETRNLHFTPDAIIEFAGQQYIVEIKGYKAEHFDKLDMAGEPPDYAHRQAQLYMHLLEISRAIILVENKNTQEIKLWVVGYDKAFALPPIKRVYEVKKAVVLSQGRGLDNLPSRICQSRDDARARKCPLREKCFNQSLEEL